MTSSKFIEKQFKNQAYSYLLIVAISAMLGLWWLRFILLDSSRKLLAPYGDLVWNLSAVQSWMNVGPFSADSHLAAGIGFTPWKLPQMGILSGLISWCGGQLGLTVNTTFAATVIIGAILNSISLFFLFTQITKKFKISRILASTYLGAGIFTFSILGHSQVRQYFALYFLFGYLIKFIKGEVQNKILMYLFSILAVALSPTWPMYVFVLVLFFTLTITLIKKEFMLSRMLCIFLGIAALGLIPQGILYFIAIEPASPPDRGFWDSNIYGGHLLDFFLSSPFLNSLVLSKFNVGPGMSIESNQIGLFGGVLAVVGVIYVLGLKHRSLTDGKANNSPFNSLIDNSLLAVTLLFLTGGFGNLLSGLTALLGFPSPGRAYSRLIILVAVLGTCKLLHYFSLIEKLSSAKRIFVPLLLVALPITHYLDFQHTPRETPVAYSTLPEFVAVNYISDKISPNCIVAQFPVDTFPTNRVASTWADVPNFHFRGFVPYLINPKLTWSFGYANPHNSQINKFVGSEIDSGDLSQLRMEGVCAILFDNLLSSTAIEREISLIGLKITTAMQPANFGRFSVFIL